MQQSFTKVVMIGVFVAWSLQQYESGWQWRAFYTLGGWSLCTRFIRRMFGIRLFFTRYSFCGRSLFTSLFGRCTTFTRFSFVMLGSRIHDL